MPLYDYICNQGHSTEKLVRGRVEIIPCPSCGADAHKVIVYKFSHKWAPEGERIGKKYTRFKEASAEIDHDCKKFESETNATVPDLGLWQKAKAQVAQRI